jgi:hypothetical protein
MFGDPTTTKKLMMFWLKVPVTEAADSLEYFYGIHQSW